MLINKVKINKIKDGMVSIPLSSNFSTETQQYEFMEKNFDLTTADIITPTVDYEKVKLYPSDNNGMADSITLKLHFYNESNWDSDSTLLTDIGFTKDDIENKRKRLSNSFIRLSFYDSKDLKKQNLLYYSIIFVDIDVIYSKYITNGLTTDNIRLDFIIENPKLTSKIKSFEGFCLFLFKDDINKKENKTIYMRADFNNAFTGKSSLFTSGLPGNINGYSMAELYDNLFYEITCSYDKKEKKYVYKINNINTTSYKYENVKNTIKIDLYQAKVI